MPLSDISIRKAKPADKPKKLSDERGLFLLVHPKGGKWWRFKYRFAGKEKQLSMGTYPDVSLKMARDRRDEARRLLSDGIDPSEYRKNAKALKVERSANSFEAIAREWYVKNQPRWAESNSSKILGRLQNDLFPWIGARPIAEINALEVLSVLQRIESRGAVESAHRVRGLCGQIFRYAVATGRAERDPTGDLRGALPASKKVHLAAITEPKEIAKLLQAIEGYDGSLIVKSALRIAPLVFVRPGELRKARWDDIDLEAAEWRYSVSKTRHSGVSEHIVPLSSQSVSILEDLYPLTGKREYVFPSNRGQGRPMSENTVNAALRYLGYEKGTMTGHGFRAMARTLIDEVLGFPVHIIEQQLAHVVRDPLGRAYNRTAHLEQRSAMMQTWADYLDSLKAE